MLKKIALLSLVTATVLLAREIDSINIKGFSSSSDLKSVIGMKVGDQYSVAKLAYAKKAILASLEASGYHHNTVQPKIVKKGKKVAVVFNVNRGDKITITKVKFIGNKNVSKSDLETKVVNKESEFMGWFPGRSNGTANVPQLKYDGLRVQDEYLKRGYLDVKVADPLMKVDSSNYTASITYNIKEGKPYKLSKVAVVSGKVIGADMAEVKSKIELHSGETFDVSKLRNDLKMMKEAVGNLGYAYAKIIPGIQKNPKNKTVAVTYKIIPGPRVTIGDVTIAGNTKTKDHVVRRYVYQTPGTLYNYTDYKDSQKALSRTGFFEKAVITPKKAKGNKIDLAVNVKEAKTGAFTLGGGYGSADGFMVNGSVSEKNIFGTGIQVSASVDYSQVKNSYSLSFTDPMIFDTDYSLSAGVFSTNSDYTDSDDYDTLGYDKLDEIGGYVSIGKKLTRELSATIGYRYGTVEYEGAATGPGTDYEDYIKSSIIASATYDSTDNYYNPREGFYAKLNLEYAGIGSATSTKKLAEFTKVNFKFAAYYGLQDQIDYDLILRYKLRVGYVDNRGYMPSAEKLYLGGGTRGVRGYSAGSIAPYTDATHTVLAGGLKSMVNSLEASIPLSEAAKMRLTFFADYGMIGVNSFDEVTRQSVGAQVEWSSPFGPINLIFAQALGDEAYDKTASFEFNMGGKF